MNTTVKEAGVDRLFNVVNYTILSLFFLAVLYPLVYIVSASFSSTDAVISGRVWLWPVEPGIKGYKAVFEYKAIWTGFGNSLFYTAIGTIINVALTIAAAYPLSRKDFIGRNAIMFIFVFTIMFSGGIIPNYLLVKDLGILDTRWAMLLPAALSVFNVIIARTYFQTTLPSEMLEAAQVDGCTDWKFLWKIVIPLSGPIIAVLALFYAVSHWNTYFSALLYLKERSLYPIQIVLRTILIQNQIDPSMVTSEEDLIARQGLADLLKYSLIVVATAPMLIVYPFVQRHFVKGVMIGSIKG
ncbi:MULTISPECIES: carbohydrate ABC transporter permease [Paenibacillus]|uniref:Carbohydrate ABC transporter permease n=1 Tax=Paenibacillus baimaensis TaxID=2982185 RepID=A0ABT2UUI6_9BACL|nr:MULTISPECIES: carbohydrate ABC transporter permease [unclassified Paenibacillus]MCU6798318.1 carbohydrate ABC transporter permease [Paenibacillus sp. WQ 127069]OMF03899.1 sugar ABC transporter permease [Paenibacillus sp. FSL H7-0331]